MRTTSNWDPFLRKQRVEVSDSWFYRHGRTESDFWRKLRRSNEHYSRTKSNHGSNRVDIVKQGLIMSRAGSNHESNRNESWVEQGRSSRAGYNQESIRVDSWVEEGRIMSQTGSNHKSNRVESWVEQGRNMSWTGSNHESIEMNRVACWDAVDHVVFSEIFRQFDPPLGSHTPG